MYKTFAKDSGEAYRQQRQQGGSSGESAVTTAAGSTSVAAMASPKYVGMHAARCFLGALSGYSGSGWLAAEEYTCTVLPTEVRLVSRVFWRTELPTYVCLLCCWWVLGAGCAPGTI